MPAHSFSWRPAALRNRLQFSLAAGLVAITFVAVIVGRAANDARRQSALIKEIEQREGKVEFKPKARFSALLAYPLRGLVSDEFFRELSGINLRQKSVSSKLLRRLSRCRRLKSLDLRGCGITDQDVPYLRPLQRLISLDLSRNPISDVSLETIGRFPQLLHLDLSESDIQGPGLEHLSSLSRLVSLSLDSTYIGDDSVSPISELDRLKSLNLSNTRITDEGLVSLSRLSRLEQFAFDRDPALDEAAIRVTRRGLAAICQMRRLTHLSLTHRDISDDELQMLGDLPRLRYLNIKNDNPLFSQATVKELQGHGVQIYGLPSDR